MAEDKKKKKPSSAPDKKQGAKKGSPAKKTTASTTTSTTSPAKAPPPRPSGKKPSDTRSGKPSGGWPSPAPSPRDDAKRAARAQGRREFSQQFLPYILGGISLLLVVCLLIYAFGGDSDELGFFGNYLCYALFGLLGWAGYLIPAVLIVLTIFWRRYHETGKVLSKVILSAVLILLLSAVSHVFVCSSNAGMQAVYSPVTLFKTGAKFESGGVLGGWIGFVLYWMLKLPVTIVLAVVTVPMILMCLFGVTPAQVFGRLWEIFKERRARRAEQRAAAAEYEEEEEDDEEDEEDEEDSRSRRPSYDDRDRDRGSRTRDRYDPDEDSHTRNRRDPDRDSRSRSRRTYDETDPYDSYTTKETTPPPDDEPDFDPEPSSRRTTRSEKRPGRTERDDRHPDDRHPDDRHKDDRHKDDRQRDDQRQDDPRSDERTDRPERSDKSGRREAPASRDGDPHRRVIHLDPDTGEVLDDDFEPTPAPAEAPAERKGRSERNRGDNRPARSEAPAPFEEEDTPLPLYDPEPKAPRDPEPPDTRKAEEDLPWEEVTAAETAPGPIPTRREEPTPAPAPSTPPTPPRHREPAPDDFDALFEDDDPPFEEDDEPIEVGFDDTPERISGRRVSYEVVDDKGETTGVGKNGEPVTVRILKTEAGAVDESGLSEEEIVLPTAKGDEELIEPAQEYQFPSPDMLTKGPAQYATNEEEIAENTEILRDVLESFRIGVREISCSCGPTITRFEVKPDTGVRVRSISNLVDDIAMGLAKAGVRIEAPIPGKSAVGIEVPNAEPSTVYLRNILETPEFRNHKSRIAACLGADVSGRPVILDINKMPHLLIAGATGTGKSVCINSLIMSILYKAKPDEVKLILIDPKKVEFAMYRDLPHLYAPVVSDPKKAAGALNSAVNEMERRFELIEEVGVRNLAGYNEITAGDPERPPLPQMVIIIDELADLMMTAPAEVETAICRLAQKARAAGIHLVIGTQRPSVDVITGLIKANVPSRIAFTVKSGVDSRTILDTVGADKLIGRGDMLYAPIGSSKPMRVQGAFVSESEVERVVTFIKENNEPPVYNEDFTRSIDLEAAKCGGGKKKGEQMAIDDFDGIGGGGRNDGEDPKFWEALEIVVTKDKIGTSALQRGCNLGYGRAAKIIDRMEELGFIGPDPGTKQGRKVYITKQEFIEYKMNGLPDHRPSDGGEDDE